MQIPLQISFENMQPSDAVHAEIGRGVERLEKYRQHIPPIVIPGLLIALLIAIVAYHAYS
jgi:hypothetical protein